jgi:LAO/AO transport system kinase
VVALTGSGGVGKSTLVGRLMAALRARGETVAVLACDPRSPVTGGALLGDRFRMGEATDDGTFIRSLAAPSGHGAIAEHLSAMIDLLEAFGFGWVLVETVGAGQGDTDVPALVDVAVLLLQPEAGDDLQWEKAGVLEVVDLVAVNKADLPGADRAIAQVTASLALSASPPPVIAVSGRTGLGVGPLLDSIAALPLRRHHDEARGQRLLRLAQELLAYRYRQAQRSQADELRALVRRWEQGTTPTEEVTEALLALLMQPTRGPNPSR